MRISYFILASTILLPQARADFHWSDLNPFGGAGRKVEAREPDTDPTYRGSTFSEVWDKVKSDPYAVLPHYKVDPLNFGFLLSKLKAAARRTVTNQHDLKPNEQKLVHANGICFKGTWNITVPTNYTGYFAQGEKGENKRGLIIARASSASSSTDSGDLRPLGIAGKIFPTEDEKDPQAYKTANFFTIDDLGGTRNKHFTDSTYTNEPPVTATGIQAIALNVIASVFRAADNGSNPGKRQVYEIAQLGLKDKGATRSPKWMNLKFEDGQTFNAKDFRDELRLKNHGGKLRIGIYVSDKSNKDKDMKKIGFIELTEDELSVSCDQGLAFHHPENQKKFD